jgi:TolB-like protein
MITEHRVLALPQQALPQQALPQQALPQPGEPGEKPRKGRKKVRSVWIAFVGRIVAQFVGSAATIGLGLLLLYRYQPAGAEPAEPSTPAATEASVPAQVSPPHRDPSLAVLPLVHFAPDAREGREDYMASSMTDILTTTLAQLPWLHVVSRTSAARSARAEQSLAAIAMKLGVRYVLEGSVMQSGDRVRITAQLIDAARDEHVWAGRYERRAGDVLGVQEDVAAAIVRELAATLAAEGDTPLPTSGRQR